MKRKHVLIILFSFFAISILISTLLPTQKGDQWILFLGFDRRPNSSTTLPDVIQGIRINYDESALDIFSIPRDLYIEGNGYLGRINRIEGLIDVKTLKEQNFNVLRQALSTFIGEPLEYYIAIDINGVKSIVDALNGISVDVRCPFSERFLMKDGTYKKYIFKSGTTFMDAEEALAYARFRRIGGDISRISHQHQVIQGIRNKYQSLSFLKKIRVLQVIRKSIYTNIPLVKQFQLALIMFRPEKISMKGLGFRNEEAEDHTITNNGQRVITMSRDYFQSAIRDSENLFELGSFEQPCSPRWFRAGGAITDRR